MKRAFRYLRIVFSATCLIACMLLIVLWVRSYWIHQSIAFRVGSRHFATGIGLGRVWFVSSANQLGSFRMKVTDAKSLTEAMRQDENGFGLLILQAAGPAWQIQFPTWWLVVAFAMLAALVAPWTRYRFSLRTLLIATTLVAMVLGLVVYATSK